MINDELVSLNWKELLGVISTLLIAIIGAWQVIKSKRIDTKQASEKIIFDMLSVLQEDIKALKQQNGALIEKYEQKAKEEEDCQRDRLQQLQDFMQSKIQLQQELSAVTITLKALEGSIQKNDNRSN